MSIRVTCPECGVEKKVVDRLAGRRIRCPKCDAKFTVPEAEPEPVAEMDATTVEALPSQAIPVPEPPLDHSSPSSQTSHSVAVDHARPEPAVAAPTLDDRPAGGPVSGETGYGDDDADDDEVLVRSKKPEEEMDMTPMVDVTFLLLIFFMVTAAFSLQKSIAVPRQQTEAPSTQVQEQEEEEFEVVDVEIDEFGSFLVLAPEWERETPGKQNLLTALKDAAGGKDKMKLNVKYQDATKLKFVVDAMDAGTAANYDPIELTMVNE